MQWQLQAVALILQVNEVQKHHHLMRLATQEVRLLAMDHSSPSLKVFLMHHFFYGAHLRDAHTYDLLDCQ